MTGRAAAFADSRAVLIGVSAYQYAEFPPIHAAGNSLRAMRALLADPSLCGWPEDRLTVIANPASAADLAVHLSELAERTTGVLLLYYVGHGVLSPRGELCLTASSTRPDRPTITGLPWETIADILRACPATVRATILDCCFAGQAFEALGADGDSDLADITHVDGVYTLTATTRNRTAHVPPPDRQATACTSFTGELVDLIRAGIPGGSPRLTFGDIYPLLRQRLRAKGLPVPSQRGTNTAHQFPFTANAAAGMSADREDAAGDGNSSAAELQPATAAAPTGPTRATMVGASRRSAPQASTYPPVKVPALPAALAALSAAMAALTAADPDKLLRHNREGVVPSTTHGHRKPSLLVEVVGALAAVDPPRARALLTNAERAAASVVDRVQQGWGLADVVGALTAIDPDRAERIARSITDGHPKAWALAEVARAVTATDPERATRLRIDAYHAAESVIGKERESTKYRKAMALLDIVGALAETDPDRAEHIAGSLSGSPMQLSALAAIASTLAAVDPDRAERIIQSLGGSLKVSGLADLGAALITVDPDRATQLLNRAERLARSSRSLGYGDTIKAWALAYIAGPIADIDPDRAERIARSITDDSSKASALRDIVRSIAATDPDRAEHIALSIRDDSAKAWALADLAGTLTRTDPDRAAGLLADADHATQWITQDRVKLAALAHIVQAWHRV